MRIQPDWVNTMKPWIHVAILANALLVGGACHAEELHEPRWSAATTNTTLGLVYRFSAVRKVEEDPMGTNFPVVIQIKNIGVLNVALTVNDGCADGIACDIYTDGKRVGSHPTVGLFGSKPLVIAPQEILTVDLGAHRWSGGGIPNRGSLDLTVAFYLWDDKNPHASWRPENEVRTAPVKIIVNPGADTQAPSAGDSQPGRHEFRTPEK
jgi:hypothetical protein